MARYIGPVCKQCRRENTKLFLKGERCYTDKCGYDRRPYPPGVHGQRRAKFTEYGIRLREKQKVRRIYGMLESQFHRYFDMADRQKGVTGENFLNLLERRLDSAVYRMGLATTRAEARQLVRHKHLQVNGRAVNIPSFLLRAGDKITVRERSKKLSRIEGALEVSGRREQPDWLEVDRENLTGTVKTLPTRDAITLPIQEQLIVEFYSR
ncbi:MAG: 30S ribosomal protein S4 [Myxococcales bacterium]|nr:30S ribosomal protein S4 [Myxococcales bacterium]MDD9966075.1 30S ribosomal protein S4 [Myxococcales bacterium]